MGSRGPKLGGERVRCAVCGWGFAARLDGCPRKHKAVPAGGICAGSWVKPKTMERLRIVALEVEGDAELVNEALRLASGGGS